MADRDLDDIELDDLDADDIRELSTPTDEEYENLSLACSKLWELDLNRLKFGEDLSVNMGSGTTTRQFKDAAEDPLFENVADDVFERPTFQAFHRLMNNYERETGVKETETRQERWENWNFLDEILKTMPMKYVHRYLIRNGKASSNVKTFKNMLYNAWFDLYRRDTWEDSCGFEHVFMGEVRDGKVIGFHNWIQFWLEEKKGNVDYRGYIFSRRGTPQAEELDPTPNLITIKFAWEDDEDGDHHAAVKSMGSSFIGVSPEFEFALYSLIFFAGREGDNYVDIGDYKVNVKCYHIRSRHGAWVGTCYPIAKAWDDPDD